MSAPIVSSGLCRSFTARDLMSSSSSAPVQRMRPMRPTLTRRGPVTVDHLVDLVVAKNATIQRDKRLNDTLLLKLLQQAVIDRLNDCDEEGDVEVAPAPVARARVPLAPLGLSVRPRPRTALRNISNRPQTPMTPVPETPVQETPVPERPVPERPKRPERPLVWSDDQIKKCNDFIAEQRKQRKALEIRRKVEHIREKLLALEAKKAKEEIEKAKKAKATAKKALKRL